jgi:hypothetical protein
MTPLYCAHTPTIEAPLEVGIALVLACCERPEPFASDNRWLHGTNEGTTVC